MSTLPATRTTAVDRRPTVIEGQVVPERRGIDPTVWIFAGFFALLLFAGLFIAYANKVAGS